jgi:CubicO group peptidase (beta-lactamase class C family)
LRSTSITSRLFRRIVASTFLALPLALSAAPVAVSARSVQAKLDAWVGPLAARHDIAGSFLVARGSEVVLCRSYGMASLELGVPNRCDTRFMIGSIAKQFTAAAILLLEEDGKLSIDDHLSKYVPDFPSGDKITLRMMMAHRSGISRDLPDLAHTMPIAHTPGELVALISHQPLVFEPGTSEAYSNNAFRVLAYIIERISGQDYGTFLAERIFAKAGMHESGDRDDQDAIRNLATGYSPWIGDDRIGRGAFESLSNGRGPGSIYSTVKDLLLWNRALGSDRVLSAASRKEMLDPVQPLGTGVAVSRGHRVISHNGVYQGYTGFLQWYPDDDLSVIYLGNIESGISADVLENAVTMIVFGEKPPQPPEPPATHPLPAGETAQYTGDYVAGPFTLSVKVIRGRLMLGAGEGYNPLDAAAKDSFFYPLKYSTVTFRRAPNGEVTGFEWAELAGGRYEFTRKVATP